MTQYFDSFNKRSKLAPQLSFLHKREIILAMNLLKHEISKLGRCGTKFYN